MKVFKVTSPDGQVISVEAPEDATDEQLIQLAQKKYAAKAEQGASARVSPDDQRRRDDEALQILLKEQADALRAEDAEAYNAVSRELKRRFGIDVSPFPTAQSSQAGKKPVDVPQPSTADLIRQKMMALENAMPPMMEGKASPELVEAAQLGASGIAAMGGYKASPVLGRAIEQVREASQRPAFSAPGTPPMTAPAPLARPMTSGEKWAANWAGQERPGVGGVPEASAAYQRSKGQGRVTGEMSKRFGPAAFPPPEPGVFQGSLADRLIAKGREAETIAREAASPLSRVSETFSTIGRTGANLLSDVLRSRTVGALGAGSVAYQGLEALKHLKARRDEEAALSGLSALGGGLMMVPTVPTAVLGGALSAAPYLYRKAKERPSPIDGQMSDVMAP